MIEASKLTILDAIGTALVSSRLERSVQIDRALRGISSGGESTVWGFSRKATPLEAALVNGMLVEALDFSDIHVGGGVHPTSVVLPALLAYGETRGECTGRDVIRSHIIGCEVMARLGKAAIGRFHDRGFQPTSITGVLGAGLAAASLMGIRDVDTLTQVLSIGSTLSFGSTLSVRVGAYFGGVDTGRAAEAGLLSALLAREGVRGIADDALEGRLGFFESYAGGGNYDLTKVTEALGREWETSNIFIKRYPASYVATRLLDGAIRLRRRSGPFNVDEIEEVRFGETESNILAFSEPQATKRRPRSIYEAKTSQYFLLALALAHGEVNPSMLETELAKPTILRLSDKIRYSVDERSHWVEVRLKKEGTVLRETQDSLVPSSEQQVRDKFLRNAASALDAADVRRVQSAIDRLEELGDVGEITSLLVGRSK